MSAEHHHARCVTDFATLHALKDRDLLPDGANETLHTNEGCGNCPNARRLGTCATFGAIQNFIAERHSEEQAVQIINKI